MSIFSFESTLKSIEIIVSVHHRHYKKMTQRHLNQDPQLGTLKIISIHQGEQRLSCSDLTLEDQIRLRHEIWNYLIKILSVA